MGFGLFILLSGYSHRCDCSSRSMKMRRRRKRGGKGIWNEGTGNNKVYTVNTAPWGKKRKLHHFSMPPAVDPKEKANQKKKGTKELRNLPKWRQPEGLEKRNMPRIHVPKTCWKINKGKLDNNELFEVNSKEEKKERRQELWDEISKGLLVWKGREASEEPKALGLQKRL